VIYNHAERKQLIYPDPKLLGVCIVNITGNAFKYSNPDSPVKITTFFADDSHLLIGVKGHGIGIPEKICLLYPTGSFGQNWQKLTRVQALV
jgi:signal transduction histidine kinase